VEPIGSPQLNVQAPAVNVGEAPLIAFVVPQKAPNFMVGLAAAVGLGLAAAMVFAVFTILAERTRSILAVLIGIAVAFGFRRFGRAKGVLAGVVAAVVTIALCFVAIFVTMAGLISKDADESFIDSLTLTLQNASAVVQVYFENPFSFVYLAMSAIAAFLYAADLTGRKYARA
jgi:hypothetical protein